MEMSHYLSLVLFPSYINVLDYTTTAHFEVLQGRFDLLSTVAKTAIGRPPELHQSLTFPEEASTRLFKARAEAHGCHIRRRTDRAV